MSIRRSNLTKDAFEEGFNSIIKDKSNSFDNITFKKGTEEQYTKERMLPRVMTVSLKKEDWKKFDFVLNQKGFKAGSFVRNLIKEYIEKNFNS